MRKQFPSLKFPSGTTSTMEDLKIVSLPLFALLGVLLFVGIMASTLFNKVNEVRDRLQKITIDNNTLKQKIEILQQKNEESFTSDNKLTWALPEKSSSVYVISQIKKKAADNLIIISEITISEPRIQGELSQSTVTTKIEGKLDSIFAFLESLYEVTPLIKVNNIQTEEEDMAGSDLVRMSVELTSYYSPYPINIPALSQPLNSLSAQEEEVVRDISNLELPVIPQKLDPQTPIERVDPFSL